MPADFCGPRRRTGLSDRQYPESGEYGLAFEARLLRKQDKPGFPLMQSEQIDRRDHQRTVIDVAREAGQINSGAQSASRSSADNSFA